MSISDMIVVMSAGLVQQIGKPQDVYDDPKNLFVAKFLGTPPINVFKGFVTGGNLYIGEEAVLEVPGVPDQDVFVGIRPEGFILDPQGPLTLNLSGVEVMGRDITVISKHDFCENVQIRSIISAENTVDTGSSVVRFSLKPYKVHLFAADTEERIYFGSQKPLGNKLQA